MTRPARLEAVWEQAPAMLREAPELAAMPERAIGDLPDYRELMVRVRSDSTLRINKMVYSVPSRWIGVELLARLHESRIALQEGPLEVARLPLSRGDRGAVIDFRHLIGHLLRKPGAFAGYRWREELFPSLVYRATYNHLTRAGPSALQRSFYGLTKALGLMKTVPLRDYLFAAILPSRPSYLYAAQQFAPEILSSGGTPYN